MSDLDRLARNLALLECGRGVREMAVICGISPATYARRRQNPEKFTYRELYRLCKSAKIKMADFYGGTLYLGGDGA